ncbi:MAG TPA: hypothetical protein VFE50_12855 [Cyclobacteriaceae bacterium]|nr:hypothetical protein [Cyclobacteriaceae bacterium]
MKSSKFYTILASALIAALIFGQVGAGFLHNKHDAHEAIIDLDNDAPVLLNHGEHCKVCAVDWAHQFIAHNPEPVFVQEQSNFPKAHNTLPTLIPSKKETPGRAPPQAA